MPFLDTLAAALMSSSAWWIPPPPPQCDYVPLRLYTIEYVSPEHCGGGSLACMQFVHDRRGRRISCRIMVVRGPYELDHIRHERAHCNCPNWVDY
jgi:hypothetical protein